jgi:hypothetical protein
MSFRKISFSPKTPFMHDDLNDNSRQRAEKADAGVV